MGLINHILGTDDSRARFFVFDYDETIARIPIDWQSARSGCRDYLKGIYPDTVFPDGIRMDEMEAMALESYPSDRVQILGYRNRIENEATGNHFPYPAVVDLIKDLAALPDARIFILSNNLNQTLRAGLRQIGIEHLFTAILGVDDIGFPKPFIHGKTTLVEQFGVIPDSTVFVGDSPLTDGLFASRASFRFVNIKEIATYE